MLENEATKRKPRKKGQKKKKTKKGEEWMTVPPKDGEPLTKKKNGKELSWCKHHKRWGGKDHTSDTCKGTGLDFKPNESKDSKSQRTFKAQKATLRWADLDSDEE